ncbi:MAG: hypothetical protein C5B56_15205 [Proteobacteria bacterium]|nr:MAG: hypothetical protein C5B56_15205 [Pseudomonadota bacterium]
MALPLPGRLRSQVAPLLAVMRHLQQQLAYSDERITALTHMDERVRRLYLGLVPRELSSGETQRRGADQQSGFESGTVIVDPGRGLDAPAPRSPHGGDAGVGRCIAARSGEGIAVVALARRLAGILFALLRDGTMYEQARSQACHLQTAGPA